MNLFTYNLKKTILTIMLLTSTLYCNSFSYDYYPNTVYKNQTFPIIVKSTKSASDNIEFIFDADALMQPVSDKPIISSDNQNNIQYKFFFKAIRNKIDTPKISILNEGEIETLESISIKTKQLKTTPDFSGIFAKSLIVTTYQVSKYDKTKNIIMLSLEAVDGNLQDMHLELAKKDESENIIQNTNSQSGSYYAIIDSSIKNITFSYFNLSNEKFVDISIPTTVKDATVAAQSNLNPDYDHFEKLKKIIYIVLAILSIIVYFRRRKKVYIFISLLFLIIFAISKLPRETICVKNGTQIHVLPVGISKISEHIDENISTKKLGEQNGFIKIIYNNNKIGWIRSENVCKN